MFRYEIPGRLMFWLMAATAGVLGYQWFDFNGSYDANLREGHASELARRVSLDLPKMSGRPKFAVAPFLNDNFGELANEFRSWVGRQNVQMLLPSRFQRTVEYVMPREPGQPAIEVKRASEFIDSGFLLCGEVQEWVTFPSNAAILKARIQLLDVSTGEIRYDKVVSVPDAVKLFPPATASPQQPAHHRLVSAWDDPFVVGVCLWIVIVLLTPWCFASWIVSKLEEESNVTNAGVIAVQLVLFAGLAWLLWASQMSIVNIWLVVLLATLTTLPYVGFVCGQLERSRK